MTPNELTPNEFLNLSYKLGDIYLKFLQFFILITIALVGWTLTSDTLVFDMSPTMNKIIYASAYAISGITFWFGQVQLLRRIKALLRLSVSSASKNLQESDDYLLVTSDFITLGSYFGVPCSIFVTTLVILFS